FNARRNTLKDDELVIVSGRLQPGRGGFEARFQVQQVWDLPAARCRFGKFLRVAVNGKAPDIARLVKDFPPQREVSEQGELLRGLGVRLTLQRQGDNTAAAAELQLGDEVKFFPTDAALASWMAQADQGEAAVVYD
ncbi:MAG: DNA polymerase III subunit alpha, partial [Rhodoferax sp.]